MSMNKRTHKIDVIGLGSAKGWWRLFTVFLAVVLASSCANDPAPALQSQPPSTGEGEVTYFRDALVEKVRATALPPGTPGSSGEVDGFLLRKAFANLQPQDFSGVRGIEGDYSVHNGELVFTGNAASTSAHLTTDGFRRLLENCARRLRVPVRGSRTIDTIVLKLSQGSMALGGIRESATPVLDAVYENYLPQNLKEYISTNYPEWSLPERYRWHPNLFKKYMRDTTLAPIVSGDFNCDGKKDYALLMDRNKKGLTLMLFLAHEQSFLGQILTQNLVHEVPKIEYVLSVVAPGVYKTIDPDREAETQSVRLQCTSIGIGLFKELYDGAGMCITSAEVN